MAGALEKGVVPVYGTRVIVGRGSNANSENEQGYSAKMVSRQETAGGEDWERVSDSERGPRPVVSGEVAGAGSG